MTIEQNLYKGSRAREILENEIYQAAFDEIEQELVKAWKQSPLRDAEGREKLHLMLTMLLRVQTCLQNTMDSGKLAEKDLMHKRTLADQAKAYLGLNS